MSCLALVAPLSAVQTYTLATPTLNDARLVPTEFVCSSVTADRISFERQLDQAAALCSSLDEEQERMSPGARVNFRTDARFVRFEFDYLSPHGPACEPFDMALAALRPGYWQFALRVDDTELDVHLGGTWSGSTFTTAMIELGSTAAMRDVSLIWPLGCDVDLIDLRLGSVLGDGAPSLQTPNPRPATLLGVSGDSISHGLFATLVTNTYPSLLAEARDWSVINLGFAGRTLVSSDANTARALMERTCAGAGGRRLSALLLAIGSNDFNPPLGGPATDLAVFKQAYESWILGFRDVAEHEDTPIFCVTPIPRGDECSTAALCNRDLEDYRAKIRAALNSLRDPNVYLFEGRDLVVPSQLTYDQDGLHPTDAGFADMAGNLGLLNLARNPGFELKALVCATPCPSVTVEDPSSNDAYLWKEVAGAAELTSTCHSGNRALRLGAGGNVEQKVYGLSSGDSYTFELHALQDPGATGSVTVEYLNAADSVVGSKTVTLSNGGWTHVVLSDTVPSLPQHLPPAVRGRIRLRNTGSAFVYVDDLLLRLGQLEAL